MSPPIRLPTYLLRMLPMLARAEENPFIQLKQHSAKAARPWPRLWSIGMFLFFVGLGAYVGAHIMSFRGRGPVLLWFVIIGIMGQRWFSSRSPQSPKRMWRPALLTILIPVQEEHFLTDDVMQCGGSARDAAEAILLDYIVITRERRFRTLCSLLVYSLGITVSLTNPINYAGGLLLAGMLCYAVVCWRFLLSVRFRYMERRVAGQVLRSTAFSSGNLAGVRSMMLLRTVKRFGVWPIVLIIFLAPTMVLVPVAGYMVVGWIEGAAKDLGWMALAADISAHPVLAMIGISLFAMSAVMVVVGIIQRQRIASRAESLLIRMALVIDAKNSGLDDPDAWRWAIWFHDPRRDAAAAAPEQQSGWEPGEAARRLLGRT